MDKLTPEEIFIVKILLGYPTSAYNTTSEFDTRLQATYPIYALERIRSIVETLTNIDAKLSDSCTLDATLAIQTGSVTVSGNNYIRALKNEGSRLLKELSVVLSLGEDGVVFDKYKSTSSYFKKSY